MDESNNFNIILNYDNVIIRFNRSRATFREADEFYYILDDMIEKGFKKFIIDLYNVDFIDSTFLGSLIVKLKQVKKIEGQLSLANLSNSVYEVVHYTRFDKIFEVS